MVTLVTSMMLGSGEVIDGAHKIDPNFKRPQPCSTLNFYDENGYLGWVQGTDGQIKFSGVSMLDTVGEHDCYTCDVC